MIPFGKDLNLFYILFLRLIAWEYDAVWENFVSFQYSVFGLSESFLFGT